MASKIHDPHPDCPDTLSCLPDTDGRPQHTLPVILRCAILGSARKRLTIREIYAAMEEKYPYYKTLAFIQQSVRHHLSLNRLFERQPRPVADPGFGSYWTVNLTAPPGTKRPRKRGRSNKDRLDEINGPTAKRRGRPRKRPQDHDDTQSSSMTASASSGGQSQIWPSQETDNQCDLEDDYEPPTQNEKDDDHISEEEEYESEEDVIYPFEHEYPRGHFESRVSTSQYRRSSTKIRYIEDDRCSHIIDHLKIEMAGLRRQSAEALSVSIRVSDQLAEAQAAASRAKAALRVAERMLEDEAKKRRDAEREADEEARRRRAAEEELQAILRQRSFPTAS